jgi:hypothetical protein
MKPSKIIRYIILAALFVYVIYNIPLVVKDLSLTSSKVNDEKGMLENKYPLVNQNDSISGIITSIYKPVYFRNSGNFPHLCISDSIFVGFGVDQNSNMEYHDFQGSVEAGDSICKKSSSDTILIIKKTDKKVIKWLIDFKIHEWIRSRR